MLVANATLAPDAVAASVKVGPLRVEAGVGLGSCPQDRLPQHFQATLLLFAITKAACPYACSMLDAQAGTPTDIYPDDSSGAMFPLPWSLAGGFRWIVGHQKHMACLICFFQQEPNTAITLLDA